MLNLFPLIFFVPFVPFCGYQLPGEVVEPFSIFSPNLKRDFVVDRYLINADEDKISPKKAQENAVE
jgi:hypothetical protein